MTVSRQFFSAIIGHEAEQQALQILQNSGLILVEQNYKAKVGEIDLIMLDGQQWVFIEVKYRSDSDYGSAAEQFTAQKRNKVVRTIMQYFMAKQMNIHHTELRLDLVAIDGDSITWLKNV